MRATTVPIDKAGRVVLPKWVREGANLVPGDELTVRLDGHCIELEPAVEDSGLVQKGDALVFRSRSGKTVTAKLVEELREERLVSLSLPTRARRK